MVGRNRILRVVALLAIGLADGGGAAAQGSCRPDALGAAVLCSDPPAARPQVMPPMEDRTRRLGNALDRPPAGTAAPDFIPARRTNSFGRTLLRPGEGSPNRRCRTDTLGSLHCP